MFERGQRAPSVIRGWVLPFAHAPAQRRLAEVTCVGAKNLPDADMFTGGHTDEEKQHGGLQ